MENGPPEDVFPTENGHIPLHFHCYVSLPEGITLLILIGFGAHFVPPVINHLVVASKSTSRTWTMLGAT